MGFFVRSLILKAKKYFEHLVYMRVFVFLVVVVFEIFISLFQNEIKNTNEGIVHGPINVFAVCSLRLM